MKLGIERTVKYCERCDNLMRQIEDFQRDLRNELKVGGPNQLPQVGDDLGEAHTALFNASQRLLAIEDRPALSRRMWRRFVKITVGPRDNPAKNIRLAEKA